MSNDKMRAEFEEWIASPPYEKPVTINPDSSGWPGQYRAYEVQLAWEAYQAARAGLVVELPSNFTEVDGYAEGWNDALDLASVSLRIAGIAGVRVKP